HHALATFCLGIFNNIFHISGSLKLMIYDNSAVLKIKVLLCQSNKLRNTKSCLKQDIDTVIVLTEMLVVLHKLQEISFLLSCDSFSCDTIVHNNGVQLKFKRI